MAVIAIYRVPGRQSAVQTARQHLENAVSALMSNFLLSREDAQGIVARGFIDWASPIIAADANPVKSANELCREILDGVGDARRATAARAS